MARSTVPDAMSSGRCPVWGRTVLTWMWGARTDSVSMSVGMKYISPMSVMARSLLRQARDLGITRNVVHIYSCRIITRLKAVISEFIDEL